MSKKTGVNGCIFSKDSKDTKDTKHKYCVEIQPKVNYSKNSNKYKYMHHTINAYITNLNRIINLIDILSIIEHYYVDLVSCENPRCYEKELELDDWGYCVDCKDLICKKCCGDEHQYKFECKDCRNSRMLMEQLIHNNIY